MDVRIFQKMKKVTFKIANEEEVMKFLLEFSEEEIKNEKFISLPLDKEMREKISKKKLSEKDKKNLKEQIRDFMAKNMPEMKLLLEKVEVFWNKEASSEFFKEIEIITGKRVDEDFICYMTNIFPGMYFDKYLVTIPYYKKYKEISQEEVLSEVSFILAEEIFHLIYYDIWKGVFNKNWSLQEIVDRLWYKNDWILWKIGEIAPQYILIENPVFKKFGWNKINRIKSYPWIIELKKISDPIWENKKNFADFIVKIHKAYNCLPE